MIARCKVVGGNPQSAPEATNTAVTWLARWTQRVIPDREMVKEAIVKAKVPLLNQAL